ncbi:MAG: restriction endonuclease subunit S [Clostridium sp.]|nr:restriction endonuclease subunit S [Clostridium sp.]
MDFKKHKLGEFIDTISETSTIKKQQVVLINTSDVENGKVLNHKYTENKNLKGQFKKRFRKDDILYSEIRPKNKRFAYVDFDASDYIASTKLMVLRNKGNIDNTFLYQLLKSNKIINQLQLLAESRSGTFPQITFNELANVEIEIPNIENQIKISKILTDIDSKIEINNQTNDNLYNMCNAIFHNYLNKYSEQIEYTKIVDIADRVITGKTPSTKNEEFWNGEIPFITIPDMHNQVFTIDTERTISDVGAKSIIPENSISVSCIATVGLVSISTKRSQTNQQINSIILKNDYDLYYLFEFLSEQERIMKNIAGGSTTYNINKTTFENIEIPYLPQSIIQEFHDTVCKVFDKIKLNQLENKNLEQLRDTLLPKLMNGEMDLDNIKI